MTSLVTSGVGAQEAEAAASQEVQPTVELVEQTVRSKVRTEGLKLFGDPGLELKVAVRVPGKPILRLADDKCRIVRFVDDVGTDLEKGAPTGFWNWVTMGSSFGEEPKDAAMLEIKTSTLPAKKAKNVDFDAVIAVVTASGNQDKKEAVALQKGTAITVGPVPMEIDRVKVEDDGHTSVGLASKQPMDAIKELQFLDADGKPFEARMSSSGSSGVAGNKMFFRSYDLAGKPDKVEVRIVAYTKMETIEVPVKLTLGVGL